jgi:hypothetical protein
LTPSSLRRNSEKDPFTLVAAVVPAEKQHRHVREGL